MARITIEDCMEQVPNRFHLVRMASIRAKQLKKGARPLIEGDQNKEVVTSLREIAAGLVKPGDVQLPPAPLDEAPELEAAPAAETEAVAEEPVADADADADADAGEEETVREG